MSNIEEGDNNIDKCKMKRKKKTKDP